MCSEHWRSVTANARYKLLIGLLVGSLLAGCQSSPGYDPFTHAADCEAHLSAIEQSIEHQQTRDAQNTRISQLPYLRSNRLLASFAKQPLTSGEQQAWLERVYQLGIKDWQIEMDNAGIPDPRQALGLSCAAQHFKQLSSRPQSIATLQANSEVKDHYSLALRTVGLYPFTRMPVISGAERVAKDARTNFSTNSQTASHIYALSDEHRKKISQSALADILATAYRSNALGLPEPDQKQLAQLFGHYAPQWQITPRTRADLPGTLQLDNQGQPELGLDWPTVYTYHSFTRFNGQALLQLNYSLWFAERPPEAGGSLYSGKLDGLIWRVTLGADGLPLWYDSVHPCGCYHKIFPVDPRLDIIQSSNESVILPVSLKPSEPVAISLQAGNHYVRSVSSSTSVSNHYSANQRLSYRLRSYDDLRRLPRQLGSQSLFDQYGLIPASRRPERFLLWPMGVRSAGAMRQAGTHAIAFTSRRHFDDAYLFEAIFDKL